jgi:hypothetical protein
MLWCYDIWQPAWKINKLKRKDSRKNHFTFYPSRLQAIFARFSAKKIIETARYSSGFAASDRTNLTHIQAPKM